MLSLIPLLTLAALAAAQTISPSVQHAKRHHLPGGWSRVRRHEPDAVLPLRFGLTQPDVDMNTLEALLNDVSHPDSPNYGMHWAPARVAEHFAPSDEAVHAVTSWIKERGFAQERVRVSKTKGWVMLNASVAETEALLNTEYHVYAHEPSGKEHVACDEYQLPAHIVPHIQMIQPTIDFNAILGKRAASTSTHITLGQPGAGTVSPKLAATVSAIFSDLDNCHQQITPTCLRALYGISYLPIAAAKNSLGIVEYTPQAYRPTDLDMFFSEFDPTLVGARPELQSVDGGVVQNVTANFGFNGESNLDLEFAMTLVTAQQKVTLYQVGDLVMGASFNNLLDALDSTFCSFRGGDDPENDGIYPDPSGYQGKDCGTITPANVVSTSYGYNEADLSPAYTARQCAEYAKLGLMGVTVLYSSGDNGVAGNSGVCLNPDGTQTTAGKIFNPSFPSTCPFVTAVGATQVNPGASVTDPESACAQVIFSGGGFSNQFAMPDYQKGVVTSYLTTNPPPYASTIYNATNASRAFPDISANGANYVVAVDGEFGLVFGTSASTPVVGAMLTMVNDARLALGKSPIGFINPTIYSPAFRGAFNDITTGTNPGCGTVGFAAATGFDPVTGLGTPKFPKLVELWSQLK
ncbi:peptidase S8/S53 domain-containing protein [Mycena rosella]|uniref:tripeptidyl-peptidase II n=1 Tax=Mycena rosella TaxID=1033263 RepID=A0AAD7DSM0_MYCRO|nr:peptidase S8/S53 domain-containing protein [Mycena rosella]